MYLSFIYGFKIRKNLIRIIIEILMKQNNKSSIISKKANKYFYSGKEDKHFK